MAQNACPLISEHLLLAEAQSDNSYVPTLTFRPSSFEVWSHQARPLSPDLRLENNKYFLPSKPTINAQLPGGSVQLQIVKYLFPCPPRRDQGSGPSIEHVFCSPRADDPFAQAISTSQLFMTLAEQQVQILQLQISGLLDPRAIPVSESSQSRAPIPSHVGVKAAAIMITPWSTSSCTSRGTGDVERSLIVVADCA